MAKEKILYTEYFQEAMAALSTRGLLLGSLDPAGKPNVMTIGWGTIGTVWSKPLWIVLVRPSRYTYQGIEKHGCFTVNVPPAEMAAVCELCGFRSGRDVDKFKACGISAEESQAVKAPCIAQCPVVYECKVVHSNDVLAPRLEREIISEAYPRGDFHRVWWGEILAARADRSAAGKLER